MTTRLATPPPRSRPRRHGPLWWAVAGLGLTLTGAGLLALILLGLLLAPLAVWLGWNVLDFGTAVGLADLGFWGIVLLALFLASGWLVRMVLVAIVFLADPGWYQGAAELHFPEPSLQQFLAIAILLAVAGLGHSGAAAGRGRDGDG